MGGGPLPRSSPSLPPPRCKQNQDMLSFYAIVIGLNNAAISRLRLTWEVKGWGVPWTPPLGAPGPLLGAHGSPRDLFLQKLPGKFKNLFRKFENLTVRPWVLGTPQHPEGELESWWVGDVLILSRGVLAAPQAPSNGHSAVLPTTLLRGLAMPDIAHTLEITIFPRHQCNSGASKASFFIKVVPN